MDRIIPLLVAMLLGCAPASTAQTLGADTLSATERLALEASIRTTSFGHYRIADSFARVGDSLSASQQFLRVDPFYLFYFEVTPESLPKLMDRVRLTSTPRVEYAARFEKVYSGPRSETYVRFQQMHEEDQYIRKVESQCADSLTCARASRRMRVADSTHFAYFYNYVQARGWPTLADGSLYASVLAIHDHEHHEYYIPILTKAVADGRAPLGLLELLLQWRAHHFASNSILQAILDTTKTKMAFDVSSLLRDNMPSSLSRILTTTRAHCPVHFHLIHEVPHEAMAAGFTTRMHSDGNRSKEGSILDQLIGEMHAVCAKIPEDVWYVRWLPAERERLMLYIVWGGKAAGAK